LLPGFLVLLALVLRVLLHVAIVADAFGIFGLVRAAGGTLFTSKLEVAVSAHSFGIVFGVSVFALCDGILLANHRFLCSFSFGPLRTTSASFLANKLSIEVHWLIGVLEVLWT